MDNFIRVVCPNPDCGKELKARPGLAGKRVKCPRQSCNTSFDIPTLKVEPIPTPVSPLPAPKIKPNSIRTDRKLAEPIKTTEPSSVEGNCFKFFCASCKNRQRSRYAHRGLDAKCGHCGKPVTIPLEAKPLPQFWAAIIVSIPMALGSGLLFGIGAGLLGGSEIGGMVGLTSAGLGFISGLAIGVAFARKNGVVMNDWICNDPILSAGDTKAAVVEVTLPEGATEDQIKPPFEFIPAKWFQIGAGIMIAIGLIPGILFGLTMEEEPIQTRILVGALGGGFVFGIFGGLFGFVFGAIHGIFSINNQAPPITVSKLSERFRQ